MIIFIIGLLIIILGWIPAMIFFRAPRKINITGAFNVTAGSLLVLFSALKGISGNLHGIYTAPLELIIGSISFTLNPLASFFLIVISVVSILSSLFAPKYLQHYRSGPAALKAHWLFYSVLTASMMGVVSSQNAVFFLISWELMSLSSFFLVAFQNSKKEVRTSAWIYLVFTHIGTAFLLVMFTLLASSSGSFDFESFRNNSGHISRVSGSVIFIFAVIGFGTKAGLVPAHVWLPKAHPAAPSHVSALMSGVMIKTPLYGIIMVTSFIGTPPAWWGWLLLSLGLISGVFGVLMATTQHNLKRLLAYSSVENIGIITMGLGIGIIGISTGNSLLAGLGFAGGLMHVLNHSLFKSLLFLGAGSVQYATDSLEINSMGGLIKRMPVTGITFLIGAAAIAGLPPFNGFISEFIIYFGAFKHLLTTPLQNAIFSIIVIGGLSLIGGLAIYCFTKVISVAFLGEPRSPAASKAAESGPGMLMPMIVFATLCTLIGLFPQPVLIFFRSAVSQAGGPLAGEVQSALTGPLNNIQIIILITTGMVVLLAITRQILTAGREKTKAETWGCGYSDVNTKMQYTSSSFVQPLTSFINPVFKTKSPDVVTKEIFPRRRQFHTEISDVFMKKLFKPVYRSLSKYLSKLSIIQHGNVHIYVLYIIVALLGVLIWSLI